MLGAFTLSSKHAKKCQTGAWPRCYQGQLRITGRNANSKTFQIEVWSFGVFWRVLVCLASINARGCNIAMLGDVTSGAELDVVLKENDRTIYTKNN